MIQLQLAGRLGNQLFQWATALGIQSENRMVTLIYDDFHQSTPSPMICRLAEGSLEIRKNNFTGHLFQLEDKYLSDSRLLKNFILTQKDPFGVYGVNQKKNYILRGYFQNWRNFTKIENEVKTKLMTLLDNWISSSKEIERTKHEIGKFHAVHVRQGDYSGTNFGLLSSDYYSRNIIPSSLPVVVFTDSDSLNDEYRRAIRPDLILTPKLFSAEDTFALMSQADSITLANSTYSWWAGFLIAKNGGKVLVPDPWLKEGSGGSALIHPGMQRVKAEFI